MWSVAASALRNGVKDRPSLLVGTEDQTPLRYNYTSGLRRHVYRCPLWVSPMSLQHRIFCIFDVLYLLKLTVLHLSFGWLGHYAHCHAHEVYTVLVTAVD